MNIFEGDVAIATLEFRSVNFGFAMDLQSALALKGEVAFRAVAVSRKDMVVFENVQAFTNLAAIATFVDLAIVTGSSKMVAVLPADVRGKMP
jgi:hypothetical protein